MSRNKRRGNPDDVFPSSEIAKTITVDGNEAFSPRDFGLKFTRSFEDPDGYIWEVFWMNPAQVQKG